MVFKKKTTFSLVDRQAYNTLLISLKQCCLRHKILDLLLLSLEFLKFKMN